jgi:two-component system response regulator CpxR
MERARILVVDDDTELCELLIEYLKPEGFDVEAVHDSDAGLRESLSGNYGLVVLDVMLPGLSGFEVLRHIRKESSVPVLMLTARGDEVDRIVGLEIGADDYLPKPFNPRELIARIRAIQRRSESQKPQEGSPRSQRIAVGDVEMDRGTRTVRRGGEGIDLTAVEFSLLELLLRSAGQVIDRGDLVKGVLGRSLSPYDRSIDVHISSLRKKLGHTIGDRERIKTIRGIGYLYALPPATGE